MGSGDRRQAHPYSAAADQRPYARPVTERKRYGVFLIPDPPTCAAVTRITEQLRAQYGLVSASAFPPHVTLVGSLPLAGEEPPALTALAAVLEDVVGSRTSFPVANAGIGWLGGSFIYDVHDWDGAPNLPLVELAAAVDAAVRPLLRPTAPARCPPTSGLRVAGADTSRWPRTIWRSGLNFARRCRRTPRDSMSRCRITSRPT